MFSPVHSQRALTLDNSLSKKTLKDIRDNFSAISLAGGFLWLGGDEGTGIERLTPSGDGFAAHQRFDLAEFVDLPEKKSEIDIEGLGHTDGFLWVIGSHSLKRTKADKDKSPGENRKLLATVGSDGNRQTLARIALTSGGVPDRSGSALLRTGEGGSELTRAFADDEHIWRFLSIPSKDNGVDVEGLAVIGDRLFIGLRGPVLRGWAIIVEIEVADGPSKTLKIRGRMKTHFLQLEGLGIRELSIFGQDLLILAGPSMDLDGPVHVFRWPNALGNTEPAVVWRKSLSKLLNIPYGTGVDRSRDHAEGITLLPNGTSDPLLLVSYDSPADSRLVSNQPEKVSFDAFSLDLSANL